MVKSAQPIMFLMTIPIVVSSVVILLLVKQVNPILLWLVSASNGITSVLARAMLMHRDLESPIMSPSLAPVSLRALAPKKSLRYVMWPMNFLLAGLIGNSSTMKILRPQLAKVMAAKASITTMVLYRHGRLRLLLALTSSSLRVC